jgi:hypothetical protein
MTWPTPHYPKRTQKDREARKCPRSGCDGSGRKNNRGSWTCTRCGGDYNPK